MGATLRLAASTVPRRRSAVEITSRYRQTRFDQMSLRQLAYWVAVVDTGSFTRAAELMHVSQPALSQQIRALEAELGGELIERLPRGIRLTPAGRAFLPEARAAVLAAERAGSAARGAFALHTTELEIATLRSIAVGVLPTAILSLYDRHPGVSVGLHEFAHRLELEQNVRSGVADIAVGPRPLQTTGPVERLGWEEFVVVVGPRDPLARRRWSRPGAARGARRPALDPLSPGTRPLRADRSRVRSCGIHPARCGADAAGRGGSSACGRWRRRRDRARRHRARRAAGLGPAPRTADRPRAAPRTREPSGRLLRARSSECCASNAGAASRATRK